MSDVKELRTENKALHRENAKLHKEVLELTERVVQLSRLVAKVPTNKLPVPNPPTSDKSENRLPPVLDKEHRKQVLAARRHHPQERVQPS